MNRVQSLLDSGAIELARREIHFPIAAGTAGKHLFTKADAFE